MTKHSIPDSAEFLGEWFLPVTEGEPRKLAGTLSWSSQRASLKLQDSFKPLHGTVYGDEEHSYPAVHGTTVKSQFISVLQASRAGTGLSFGPAGMSEVESLISSWIVVGAHVVPKTLYSEIRVRIPGLQIWLCRSGVQRTMLSKTENSPPGMIYRIDGLAEEITEITCPPLILGWGIDRHFSGDMSTEISVRTSACLRIHSAEPKELDWFFAQLGKATTLLSFMAGSPMAPDHISAKAYADEGSATVEVEVLVALREAKYCPHRTRHDFYMLRPDMEADLDAVFSRWFELYDSIAMPSQLALSVLCSDRLWLHVEFLSLMQALEGFHRATMTGLYTDETAYEPTRQAMSNAIPQTVAKDHRDALKARIKYGNEISLRKRLDALVSCLDLPLRKHILGGDGTVPRSWVVTRNYYTHWDEASRADVLDGIGMHQAHVRMRLLLKALYLNFVGIPQTAIAKSLRNTCQESQYLIQLNNAAHRQRDPESGVGAIMHVNVKDPESPGESSA